jgi:hypothetical protein
MNGADLPGPPADLAEVAVTLITLDEPIFRTHGIHRGPVFYGNSGLNRFDAPDRSYNVLYAGRDPFCAFVETFAKAAGTRVITTTELKNKALAELKANRPLRLIDLTQSGTLVRIGADSRLFSTAHEIAQVWSKALHEHPCKADGLLYPSRLDPVRHALVLFGDRAPKMTELKRQSWYAPGQQRTLLTDVVEHYGIELIENQFVPRRKPAARAIQDSIFEE